MQKNLLDFFKKSDKHELPSKWLSDPLPPKPKKKCVGRPTKSTVSATNVSQTANDVMGVPEASLSSASVSPSACSIEVPVVDVVTDDIISASVASSSSATLVINCEAVAAVPQNDQPVDHTEESPPSSPASVSKSRGKYKSYTIVEKRAMVEEAAKYGVIYTAGRYKISVTS